MKKGMIITLPRYDAITEYISQFSIEVIKEADSKNIPVKRLKDKEVNMEEVEKTIKKLDYKFIFFNGHGSKNSIFGNKEAIIIGGRNHKLLSGKIVYARSCDAVSILGRKCIEHNPEGCFIGYDRPFQVMLNSEYIVNPLKDNIARLFLEPSNLVPISILKGNTALNANENSKKNILKNINKVLRNPSKDAFQIAQTLWNNYEGQVLLGNQNISLN